MNEDSAFARAGVPAAIPPKTSTSRSEFVSTLASKCKQYSDIIGILVLIGGAITWCANYFATKAYAENIQTTLKDYTSHVACFARETKDLSDAQVQQLIASSDILKLTQRAATLETKDKHKSIDDDERMELKRSNIKLLAAQEALKEAKARIAKSNSVLLSDA